MKTVEITRHKQSVAGAAPESTFKVFLDIYRREGIAGINKGVNAVALRQATNWGSRFGFARLAESSLRKAKGIREGEKLGAADKILASTIGGALATWNQPIEVVRVEVSVALARLMVDAIRHEVCRSYATGQEDCSQHAFLHLPHQRSQGSLPRCRAEDWAGYVKGSV